MKILMMLVCLIFGSVFFVSISTLNIENAIAQELEFYDPDQKEKPKAEKKEKEQEQEQVKTQVPLDDVIDFDNADHRLYYKEQYEETWELPFEDVWNAAKETIIGVSCQIGLERVTQTDEGLFRGSLRSDYCVFTDGSDSTFRVLRRFSLDMPFIRGGLWLNGRMLYKLAIRELEDGSVRMIMTTEMSGFENKVTHQVHFWKSNGFMEHIFLQQLRRRIAEL